MTSRVSLLFAAGLFAASASAAELNFTPLKSSGIYQTGETVSWSVTTAYGFTPKTTYSYTVKENGGTLVSSGTLDLSQGSATLSAKLDHPGMLMVTVDRSGTTPPARPTPADVNKVDSALKTLLVKNDPALKAIFDKYPSFCLTFEPCGLPVADLGPSPVPQPHIAVLGAAVSPTKIQPVAPRPADFDAFWAEKLAALAKVPMHPILTEIAAPVPGIKFYKVQLDSLNSHVQGYLAVPLKKGPHPAMIQYQWAGVYALIPSICANRAAEGWLCFNVSSHDMPLDSANGTPKNYYELGNQSRETSYYLNMYLRDTRALQWVRSLPEWNKKTLVVTGTSMGGHQSLVTAGLNPGKVTAVLVNEPSGGDTNAVLKGRLAAYPNWPVQDPRVAEASRYFDTANFTPHITAPTMAAIGFIDTTCPPATIFSAVNQIKAPKEIIPMIESEHNNYTPDKQAGWLQRSEEVLAVLLHGSKFVPDEWVAKTP
ncbi:cephalosporin-C deacetylase-like acetyl esterase [Rhizomicrobium palustre]|uniref:Cephalosporin-C deacetylase-like acetyl esterase n=1 Tax=Rhizomicrobium palustre TaxID=189966 RepID=A0A846N4T1_9PROT|nr:acetylxylan esterase [Rhizomicrobium palustre]NIK90040.1 cephalosporin-C deacetylase-like acetyl esterase [Rhizomicrobium palustre]